MTIGHPATAPVGALFADTDSPTEAQAILGAGLAIVPVQHVRPAGWMPTAAMGKEDGMAAAKNAAAVGCPAGVCVWLDLEGVSPEAAPADVIGYCQAWYAQVLAPGFVPSVYVGASPGLDAEDLYWELDFEHYWHSGSSSAPVPVIHGAQIVQTIDGDRLGGVSFDSNVVRADAMGGLPVWWVG